MGQALIHKSKRLSNGTKVSIFSNSTNWGWDVQIEKKGSCKIIHCGNLLSHGIIPNIPMPEEVIVRKKILEDRHRNKALEIYEKKGPGEEIDLSEHLNYSPL